MAYEPFKIQKEAHNALLSGQYYRALLYWSRRCLAEGTLVSTDLGDLPIEKITVGMNVWASDGYKAVLSTVTNTHKYGVDIDPKPMIACVLNGREIRATYDHEIHVGDDWVPLYIVAWGAMAASDRLQLKLLCEQYGAALDDDEIRSRFARYNASSERQVWLLQDGDERAHGESAPRGSADLDKQPIAETASKSHRQRPLQQSHRKLGMGHESRESGSHDASRPSIEELRREKQWPQTYRGTGQGNTAFPIEQSDYEQIGDVKIIGRAIPTKTGKHQAHFERQYVEVHTVSIHVAETTYDLTTEHHNYTANGINIHNTGKTLWSIQQLMMSCMLHQGPHHIVFKEYQQAETVAWNQYIHLIPKQLIKEMNKSTLTVTFNYFEGKVKLPISTGSCHNVEGILTHFDDCDCIVLVPDYSKPPASIRLLGSDKADQHRGGESYGMIFDEYQDQDPYGWDFVYKYFLATTNGWAAFMGTAKSDDHWNELLARAELSPNWYYSKATWRENPKIEPAWIAQERSEAIQEGKLSAFLQETELIPFSQQGAVYPMFDRKIHVVKPDEIPVEGTEYIALDFGFAEGHPMAACFVRITRDDVWYQWDEIHGTGIQIDDLCAEIRTKMGDRLLTNIVADSARPDLIEYMQSKGFPVIPSPKKQNSIVSGIHLLSKRLRPKIQIIGEPQPNYFLGSNCKGTIYDFEHYRYKEIKQNRPPQELPEKRYDDSLDALRYLELFFKFGQQKDEKPIKSSMLGELNGYGLL